MLGYAVLKLHANNQKKGMGHQLLQRFNFLQSEYMSIALEGIRTVGVKVLSTSTFDSKPSDVPGRMKRLWLMKAAIS